MFKRVRLSGAASWFAALTLSAGAVYSEADAATYVITYTGHVTASLSYTDDFGLHGLSALDGQAFTAIYTLIDPSPGVELGSYYSASRSGSYFSLPGGVLSGTLTINGVTRAIDGQYMGLASQVNDEGGVLDEVYHEVRNDIYDPEFNSTSSIFNFIQSNTGSLVDSPYYTSSLNYSTTGSEYLNGGGFKFIEYHYATNKFSSYVAGNLINDSVTIRALAAVPESATWVMMIAGFGLAGAVQRRRGLAWQG